MDAFRPNIRSVTSPVGIILILGLTLTAAVGIAVFGSVALQGAQDDTRISQAEQSMVQFDSRAAQVALGDSQTQTVSLGSTNAGTYHVDENAGQLRIYHDEYDGSNSENITGDEPKSMGAVIYELGDKEVAYQGGGVWRKDGEGRVQMVSPPEFHYRSATLTFPIISIGGSGSAGGDVRARTSQNQTAIDVFPHPTDKYPNDDPYNNPVAGGNMTVELTSEYCEGWQRYFEERTEGEVKECTDGTVEAQLITRGQQGEFRPLDGETLDVRSVGELNEFEVTLTESGAGQSSGFNNHGWSMYAQNGTHQLELHSTSGGVGNEACDGDSSTVVIYYSGDGGNTYHTWVNDDGFEFECPDGSDEVTIDFLGDVEMTYQDYDDELQRFTAKDGFSGDESLNGDYTAGESESIEVIIREYFDRIGDMDMTIEEKNNAGMGVDSSGTIRYEGGADSVTYLHITENRIEVQLSS